jgi:uroporphyrinogen-III decarboxylase
MQDDRWSDLTADQRYEARMRAWQEPEGLSFSTPESAAAYAERTGMLRDVLELRKPARVPLSPWSGLFPVRYAGMAVREAYYDHERLAAALVEYHQTFRPDTQASFMTFVPGAVLESLDYRMYDWPGNGTDDDSGYQYNEAEYMRDDEFGLLLTDPSAFWQRRHVPRMFGALEPMRGLPPLTDLGEIPSVAAYFTRLGAPEVQEMLARMMEAGRAAREWFGTLAAAARTTAATAGIPGFTGGIAKAPYDMLGDTMRGTRGVMLDKFRRPGELIAAMERLVPIAVESARRAADASRNPFIFMPLHKGADGFLSGTDFQQFYWPTLKAVILGLIAEGLVPQLFVEGAYNARLDVIVDDEIPAGRTLWLFDATDMAAVRDRLRGFACFGGNVPGALLSIGTPDEVDEYVRRLLEEVAGEGGFILSTGIVADDARAENFRDMMEAGRRYGG